MQDPGTKLSYSAIDVDPMGVTVLFVDRFRRAIKNIHWRVDAATKWFSVQTIDELNSVTIYSCLRFQVFELVDQFISQDVIGIQRQNPGRLDVCLCQTERPLILMSVESSLKESGLRKRPSNDRRFVIAETVDDHNVVGPGQLPHCSLEIRSFVVSKNEWCDLIRSEE